MSICSLDSLVSFCACPDQPALVLETDLLIMWFDYFKNLSQILMLMLPTTVYTTVATLGERSQP